MTEQELRQLPLSELREKVFWSERFLAKSNDLVKQSGIPLSQEEQASCNQISETITLAYKILRGE